MQRQWVIDLALYPGASEELLELVAAFDPDNIVVENMRMVAAQLRDADQAVSDQAALPKQTVIRLRFCDSILTPLFQKPLLYRQHGGLQRIEPGIDTHHLVIILGSFAVHPEHSDFFGEIRVLCRN